MISLFSRKAVVNTPVHRKKEEKGDHDEKYIDEKLRKKMAVSLSSH